MAWRGAPGAAGATSRKWMVAHRDVRGEALTETETRKKPQDACLARHPDVRVTHSTTTPIPPSRTLLPKLSASILMRPAFCGLCRDSGVCLF